MNLFAIMRVVEEDLRDFVESNHGVLSLADTYNDALAKLSNAPKKAWRAILLWNAAQNIGEPKTGLTAHTIQIIVEHNHGLNKERGRNLWKCRTPEGLPLFALNELVIQRLCSINIDDSETQPCLVCPEFLDSIQATDGIKFYDAVINNFQICAVMPQATGLRVYDIRDYDDLKEE